ncbi:hypothetical protein BKA81DRAFT_382847 [Phyllosticta paracitricarpa]
MAQYDDYPPNTLLTLFQYAFWIAIFSYLFWDQFWRPILGIAPSLPPSPPPTPEATLQQQQPRVQAPAPEPNAPGNPPNANAERQICPCPNCRPFENARPTDRERQQQNAQNPPPQQPRIQAQPRGQNPHGPVRRPPWRAPDFRNLPVLMNRRVNRNAEGITPPPGAARRQPRPRPRPQVFQLPAGTVLNGGNNTNGNGAAEAPLPAPVVDQRIRERDLILPLLFPLPMTVGSPVEPLRAANPNGLFTTAQPLFPPIQQGTGNGNGATQPQLPAAELPGQNLQPRNENEQIPAPREMDVVVNFVMLPSPMAQTLVDDPNGFWETARAIDPQDAGVDADSVVFDTHRHPRNRVHDYIPIDDLIVDDDGDVIMTDLDDELDQQLQEHFIQHWMSGGFSDEDVNRFAQGERLRGSTDATAADLRRRFMRWRRDFLANLARNSSQGYRDV